MTAKVLGRLKQRVDRFTLVPSDGGRFEIEVDGDLIYSKLSTGSFPDEAAIVREVDSRS